MGYGRIFVTTDPSGADVFINSRKIGHCYYDGLSINLHHGWYRVMARKEGYEDCSQGIRLKKDNEIVSVKLTLKAKPEITQGL